MGFFSPASLFKILKGELRGERIAEIPTFWACAEHPNCRECFRIAVNCSRIAARIAGGRRAELHTCLGHAQNIRIAESMFPKCRGLPASCHPNCRIAGGRVAEFPHLVECAGRPNCHGCFPAADGDDGDGGDDEEEGDDDDHDDGDGNDDDDDIGGDDGGSDGGDDNGDNDGDHGADNDDDGDVDDGNADDGDEDDEDDGGDDGDYTIFLLMGDGAPKYNLLKKLSLRIMETHDGTKLSDPP